MTDLLNKCPKCGGEMEKGYVNTGMRISWSKKETPGWSRRGEETLVGSFWSGTCHEAYRCPKCKIVVFSYGEEMEE